MLIPPTPHPTRSIDLPSGPLTYCDIGDSGTNIILLHGLSFRPGLYPLIEHLLPHFRVIALDLPFHSPDHAAAQKNNIYSYVNLVLEFVTAMQLRNPAIFGNSLGGTLGLMCALEDPTAFSKLVLRAPLWTPAQLPAYLRLIPLIAVHLWLSRFDPYANFAMDTIYLLSKKMSPQAGEATPSIPIRDLFTQFQVNPTVLSAFLGHLVQVDLSDQLSRIPNPTLILWGKEDALTPSIWGARLTRCLPEARFMEVAAEYHNIATTDPHTLAHQIAAFVLA